MAKRTAPEKPLHYQLSHSQITQFSKALTDKLVFQCQSYLEHDQWIKPEQDLVLEQNFLLRRVAVNLTKVSYRINSNTGDAVLDLTIEKKRSKNKTRKICQYRLDVYAQHQKVLSERIINVMEWQRLGGEKIISQYLHDPATEVIEQKQLPTAQRDELANFLIEPLVRVLFYGLAGM